MSKQLVLNPAGKREIEASEAPNGRRTLNNGIYNLTLFTRQFSEVQPALGLLHQGLATPHPLVTSENAA
jgi:hypothetical protein